jgi:hypothetical protein
MNYPTTSNLLRRTAIAITAVATSLVGAPALSATLTLGGASAGENCAYSGMTVDPSGNITVSCTALATGGQIGSTPPPPPPPTNPAGTFAVSAPASLPAGSTSSAFTITRTGGTTGVVNAVFSVSGTACTNAANINLYFGDGSAASIPAQVPLTISTSGGTCTITLNSVSAGALGTPTIATITVGTTTPTSNPPTGTITPPPGCPTPPLDTVADSLPASPGAHLVNDISGSYIMKSGVVYALKLPALPSGIAEGAVQLSYSAVSAKDPSVYEISVSKCPGIIDPAGTQGPSPQPALPGQPYSACYFVTNNGFSPSQPWFGKPSVYYGDKPALVAGNQCWAGESEGTWYANVRLTYTTCNFGSCGEMIQWQSISP